MTSAKEKGISFFVAGKKSWRIKNLKNSGHQWTVFSLPLHLSIYLAVIQHGEAAFHGSEGKTQLPGRVAFGGLLTLPESLFPPLQLEPNNHTSYYYHCEE